MKYYKLLVGLLAAFPFLTGCENQFEPEGDNHRTIERVLRTPTDAEGFIDYAYQRMPFYNYRFDEVGTDDAVSNVSTNTYLRIATGGWTALNNPQSVWDDCYRGIMNLCQFIDIVDDVVWSSTDEALRTAYANRLKGEAYALRGILYYCLLRNHAGVGTDGQLLGVPYYDHYVSDIAEFSEPRETFANCVSKIYADFTEALKYLPQDYGDVSSVPSGYSGLSLNNYNKVYGNEQRQRLSGRHVNAFKARLALLVASPAFNLNNDNSLWETAANNAGQVIRDLGGISGLDPKGHQFFLAAQVNDADLTQGDKTDTKEMIWRRSTQNINTWEANNYPPSLYGQGQINPTQNLVDAFPMKNGYPISDPNSGFDPKNPYANRDPRLADAIVFDGSKVRNTTINILSGDSEDRTDVSERSTRTGYYMRKLLREDVNMDPKSTTNQKHIVPFVRATEIFLAYAEAANEAWGPTATGSFGFSAKDVIAAIRQRAGIDQPDAYLESITTKEAMRELIRNERRLETCFESVRFWDLRRWKANLGEAARGIRLNNGNYETFTVEERAYNNNMIYGPIPFNEVLKFGYVQNQGW